MGVAKGDNSDSSLHLVAELEDAGSCGRWNAEAIVPDAHLLARSFDGNVRVHAGSRPWLATGATGAAGEGAGPASAP